MIYNCLHLVSVQLNLFLMKAFRQKEQKAILGTIVNEEGEVPEENRNKVVLSLVNMEWENTRSRAISYVPRGKRELQKLNEPYNFNLDILVTSLFTDYAESLKFLSETVYFFQAHNLFDHENTPGLSPKVDQLTFELVRLNYFETHNLWQSLGAKYMPSVLFKMRMLSFQDSEGVTTYRVLDPEADVEQRPPDLYKK